MLHGVKVGKLETDVGIEIGHAFCAEFDNTFESKIEL